MVRILIGILAIYLVGYTGRRLLFLRNNDAVGFCEAPSLDIGLGLGISTLLFFYAAFLGLHLTLLTMSLMLLPFWCIATYLIIKGFKEGRYFRFNLRKLLPISEITLPQIILIVTIVLVLLALLFYSLFLPLFEWAARTVFDFTAKILFYEKTIYSEALLEADRVHEHPEYPMIVPLAEIWFYNVLGYHNDRLVKIVFFLIGFALILSFYSVLRKFTNRTYALIFTVFFCCTEAFIYRTYTGEADVPMSFFYFVGGAYLFLWMHKRKISYFLISTLFIAFTMFTKAEGAAFFAILVFCMLLFLFFDKKEALRKRCFKLITYIAIPVVLILPWQLFRLQLPDTQVLITMFEFNPINIIVKFSQNYSRTTEIIRYFIDEMLIKREWHTFWILFIISQLLFIKITFKKPMIYLTLNVWISLMVYYITFIIIFVEPAHMLVGMGRFCLQIAPLAAFLMSLQIYYSNIFNTASK